MTKRLKTQTLPNQISGAAEDVMLLCLERQLPPDARVLRPHAHMGPETLDGVLRELSSRGFRRLRYSREGHVGHPYQQAMPFLTVAGIQYLIQRKLITSSDPRIPGGIRNIIDPTYCPQCDNQMECPTHG